MRQYTWRTLAELEALFVVVAIKQRFCWPRVLQSDEVGQYGRVCGPLC